MKSELKAKWLEALRSGEYEKGIHRLHKQGTRGYPDTYCCLGVLCAIDERMKQVDTYSSGSCVYEDPKGQFMSTCLSLHAAEMYGFEPDVLDNLMITNDKSLSFDPVIAIIEKDIPDEA